MNDPPTPEHAAAESLLRTINGGSWEMGLFRLKKAIQAVVAEEREAVREVFTGEASYDAEVHGFLEEMWAKRDGKSPA